MAKKIITISRTYGSGGRLIGEKLAKELGISYYDKELLKLMSEKSGISEQGIANADEKILNRLADQYSVVVRKDYNTNLYLFNLEKKIITELAEKESCVIIGRLSDWILKDHPDALKVFITAPDQDRIARIMEYEKVSEKEAEKLMKQVDKMRKGYYNFFTDRKWMDPNTKDLIINSSVMGIDGTVDILKYIVSK